MSLQDTPFHIEREVIEHLRVCEECRERFDSFISFTYQHISTMKNKCEEHDLTFKSPYEYHLHIINEHDPRLLKSNRNKSQ